MSKAGERHVDAYIRSAPTKAQPMLKRLRELIKAAAPEAEERISYGMPFYEYHGRLVYFAGYANHIGLYAAMPANNLYAGELKKYMAAKSTLRFPLGDPLPDALVTKIVKKRVQENEAKAK